MVVLDTNVVVSAYLSPFGPPARILDLVMSGKLEILLDERILAEYTEVLLRPRFRIAREAIEALVDYLSHEAEFVLADPLSIVLPDMDDLPFLEVAVAGRADALVSGNLKDYPRPVVTKLGVRAVTPADFLRSL